MLIAYSFGADLPFYKAFVKAIMPKVDILDAQPGRLWHSTAEAHLFFKKHAIGAWASAGQVSKLAGRSDHRRQPARSHADRNRSQLRPTTGPQGSATNAKTQLPNAVGIYELDPMSLWTRRSPSAFLALFEHLSIMRS